MVHLTDVRKNDTFVPKGRSTCLRLLGISGDTARMLWHNPPVKTVLKANAETNGQFTSLQCLVFKRLQICVPVPCLQKNREWFSFCKKWVTKRESPKCLPDIQSTTPQQGDQSRCLKAPISSPQCLGIEVPLDEEGESQLSTGCSQPGA